MWSKTFTDAYGWRWTFRRQSGPAGSPVQFLVTPPEEQRNALEPFSYGLDPADLGELARILEEARAEVAQESPHLGTEDAQAEAELAAGRDPRD